MKFHLIVNYFKQHSIVLKVNKIKIFFKMYCLSSTKQVVSQRFFKVNKEKSIITDISSHVSEMYS